MCSAHLLLLAEVALGLQVWGGGPGGTPRFPWKHSCLLQVAMSMVMVLSLG